MVTTSVERIVAAFEDLGLSSYEARAYSALLKAGPVTGYQLSRVSGVPRSRVYEALEKLARRGMVLTQNDQPQRYAAAPLDEVLDRALATTDRTVGAIRRYSASLSSERDLGGVWNITGRDNLMARMRSMIHSAARTVAAVAPSGELAEMQAALEESARNGRQVRLVTCGDLRSSVCEVYQHQLGDTCDDLALVVDGAEALVGQLAATGEETSAAWSHEPGFVHITEEYVLHEIFLAQALSELGPSVAGQLGDLYRRVMGTR